MALRVASCRNFAVVFTIDKRNNFFRRPIPNMFFKRPMDVPKLFGYSFSMSYGGNWQEDSQVLPASWANAMA